MADTHHLDPIVATSVATGTADSAGSKRASAAIPTTGLPPRRRRRNRGSGAAPREPIANLYPAPASGAPPASPVIPIRTVDEARSLARERFRDRVQAGEQVGGCDCHSSDTATEPGVASRTDQGPEARVAGVRFRDSGRLYYFDAAGFALEPGEWVVADTERGDEAGRVIIAPHQVLLSQLQGELRPILRRLSDDDVKLMERLRRESSSAVRTFSDLIHEHRVPVKPISAVFSFDGAGLTLSYAPHQGIERPDLRALGRALAGTFGCRVDLVAVSPREEARLLGGLGRCGRTLCCSSWLPVFPEITMGMAKTQDLALNPSKVSGVCGRLLCCLSYENEQYKQLKSVLPRLGQRVETPKGWGQVVSLQVLKEQLTVRLEHNGEPLSLASSDLGPRPGAADPLTNGPAPNGMVPAVADPAGPAVAVVETDEALAGPENETRRRRRRRPQGVGDQAV